jgi:hypothetical protein
MSTNKNKETLIVHNVKNSNYRQVHVDGAHGGITPSGYINLNFYSQRGAIPRGTKFEVSKDGQIGKMIENIENSKEGIVREFEFGVYMDLNTCESLKEFLELKIKEYKSVIKEK